MIGKQVSHYKILEEIGQGGMGVVYKAEDTNLKRTVALKFLSPQALGSEEDKQRFLREAQAAAALDHPNICTVYEIDEADGNVFMAMPYVDGLSLSKKIEEKPMKLDQALDVAIQVAQGLQEAHEKDIVHRDIKSSNIMLTEKGQAKIMDFGLAKKGGQTMMTKEGTTLGTISYMSPEQSRGEEVDSRTDIWSFGVMLYEMISGQLPFKGEYEQAVIYSIMNEEAEPLTALRTGVPMELERIVNKAMAKNQNERYQRIEDMQIDLRVVQKELETEVTTSRPVTTSTKSSSITLMQDLRRRRMPQIVGVYLAFSFGVVQFVDWLVRNFPISPNLPTFSFVALASMIPTVLLLAYFHGKPGRDQWTRYEKLGIPANLIAAAAILFLIFQDKELGAVTQKVTVTDDEGQTIERVIPKSEFRKRLAIFYFENESGDTTHNWLQYGLTELLKYDLDQDLYLDASYGYFTKMKESGYAQATGAPLSLKKKIAGDAHRPYFLAGSFTTQDDTIRLTTQLHETQKGKLITENTYSATSIFQLVDSISPQLKQDLDIPIYHIEQSEDLPVSGLLTHSVPAFRLNIRANNARLQEKDWNSTAAYLEKAVALDPTFAYGYYRLHSAYWAMNQRSKAEQAIGMAMQHKYNLPERYRFLVKSSYYELKGDKQKVVDNAQSWVQLFPEATDGHHKLADEYEVMGKYDEAVEEHKIIYELDPESVLELLHIGDTYEAKGDFEKALVYFEQYAQKYPEDVRGFQEIGNVYQMMGNYDSAKTYYRKALLIEPEKISLLASLGYIDIKLGNFPEALAQFESALRTAKTPQDSSSSLQHIVAYYTVRGQINKAIELMDLVFAEMRKFNAPVGIMLTRFNSLPLYCYIGRENEAFEILSEIEAQPMVPPFDFLPSMGYILIYSELKNDAEIEKAADQFESFLKMSKLEVLRPLLYLARGQVFDIRGQYGEAAKLYEKAIETSNPQSKIHFNILVGESYRKLGEYEKAEKALKETLDIEPFQALALFEIAQVYYAIGNKDKAKEHLKLVLKVWEEADTEYKPAKKAREKLAEWGAISGS